MNPDRYEQTTRYQGSHVADEEKMSYFLLDQHTPRHADFPFQIVHLYHAQLDIYSESSLTRERLGIPWVTFAVDACSRRQLAVYLAINLPKYSSYMMALRECVRRYARLPQILVVDEGPGFNSDPFEALLAHYRITKVERPLAELNMTSSIERLFGMTDTNFIEDVLGNTQTDENLREMTKTNSPNLRARWPLEMFYKRLCEWCYEKYDNRPYAALGQTPRESYQDSMLLSSAQSHHMLQYDKTFFIMTLPMGGEARVSPWRGVKGHYGFYWSDAFRSPEVENVKVPIRYDPSEMDRVFAFVKGQWVQCLRTH